MPNQSASSSGGSAPRTGPVGQGDYVVRQGDCTHSIAGEHGFFWETLWDLPENAELKRLRRDPNVLLPGDRVTVPDLRAKEEDGATETRHRFKRRGVPAMLRLELTELEPQPGQDASGPGQAGDAGPAHAGEAAGAADGDDTADQTPSQSDPVRQRARAQVPYVVSIDGHLTNGVTDDQGRIEIAIPPNARRGRLVLHPGTNEQLAIPLELGCMDPVTEIAGVRKRLRNLGFPCAEEGEEVTQDLLCALSQFQETNGIPATGQPDQATRDRLVELHGS